MDSTDEQVFRRVPAARPDPNRFTLISHGTVEERYGLDTAIDAVALLRNEIPELVLKIYGEGSDLGATVQGFEMVGELRGRGWVSFEHRLSPLHDGVLHVLRGPGRGVLRLLPGRHHLDSLHLTGRLHRADHGV